MIVILLVVAMVIGLCLAITGIILDEAGVLTIGGICVIVALWCLLANSYNNRDKGYKDHAIESVRYHVEKDEHGTFVKKTDYKELLEVIYEDGKKDFPLSDVNISSKSFVRIPNSGWGSVELHLTKEDYNKALEKETGGK